MELADQTELFERRLELGAEDAPLDPVEREQRGFDRRALGLALEVGTKACSQVARAADVEHLVLAVAEEVHTGPRRCAADQRALAVHAALARSGQRAQVGYALGSQLLREPDQVEQDLGGRLGVGQRPVAWGGRHAEQLREGGEADLADAASEQAAGERRRAQRRLRQPAALTLAELSLEEALVESGVVGDERRLAREGQEAADDRAERGGAAQVTFADAGQTRDRRGEGDARIDEGLERVGELQGPNADSAQLADPARLGREPRRLQVEHDELGLLEQQVR